MPVTVEVPIHLVVDREALELDSAEIGIALTSALRSVLANAKQEVLDKRGGYVGVDIHVPEFIWSGIPVENSVKSDTENLVSELISEILEITETYSLARESERVDVPLGEDPFEMVDMRRRSALFGMYTIPQYEDGDDVSVPTEGANRQHLEQQAVFVNHRSSDIDLALIFQYLVQLGVLTPDQTLDFPVAVLFKIVGQANAYTLCILRPYLPARVFEIPPLARIRLAQDGDVRWISEPDPHHLPAETGTLSFVAFGSSHEENAELLRPHIGATLRSQLERLPHPDTISQQELAIAYEQAIATELVRQATGIGAGRVVMIMHLPGNTTVLPMNSGVDVSGLSSITEIDLYCASSIREVLVSDDAGSGGGSASSEGETGDSNESGRGDREGGNGSGGTGSGGGAAEQRSSGVVFTGTDGTGAQGSIFPSSPRAPWQLFSTELMTCSAFQGEPSCEELEVSHRDNLKGQIDTIAARLQLEPCYYAGNFCLMAAEKISFLARVVAEGSINQGSAFYQPVQDRGGRSGSVRIRPTTSPAIQLMRHLAGTVAMVTALSRQMYQCYERIPERFQLGYPSNLNSWHLHYLMELGDQMDYAVQQMFEQSCRVVLLQFLETSRLQIQGRIDRLPVYAPMFEMMITNWLRDPVELERLRSQLQAHRIVTRTQRTISSLPVTGTPADAWVLSARAITSLLLATETIHSAGEAGEIVESDGVFRIRDSHGKLWTEDEISNAILTQRGLVEDIDPLVKQIRDIPELFSRFTSNPNSVQTTLSEILDEMRANNAEMLQKTRSDPKFGFRASTMIESIPEATIPNSRYVLGGIHFETHMLIGEFFHGSPYYARGVDQAIGTELGMRSLESILIGIAIVGLCVFFPPLGFIAGIAVAVVDVVHAHERSRLYGALINPDLVLSRAEVEVEMFIAYFGLVLSFLPEIGTIAKVGSQGFKVGLRVGVPAGLRSAGRYAMRHAARQMAEAASRQLLTAFITEFAINELMNPVIERALAPLIEAYQHEATLDSSPGGSRGASHAIRSLGINPPSNPTEGGTR